MKKFKNFILESNMNTSDFQFKTKLSNNEIYFNDHGEYDDVDDVAAIVYWHIKFEWMGDDGIDYYINVDKVAVEYTGIIYEDEKEEKTLIIDDPDKIEIETTQTEVGGYSRQIIPKEININGDVVEIVF